MDHLAFALNPPPNRQHAGGKHNAALFLEQRGPDYKVSDAGFGLDGDDHDTLGAAWPLPHQDNTRPLEPAPVPRRHRIRARDDTTARDSGPHKLDRMPAYHTTHARRA